MTPWIFGLAVSEFIAGITCLVIGGYTLAKARSSLNVLFFGLSLPLALVGMAEGFVTLAPDAATARLWMNLAFLGWLLFLPTYIKFSTTFCAVKFKILPLFYLLAAAFFGLVVATPYFISAMTSRFYGYFYEPGSLNITYVLFYLICVCAGLYFFFFSCLRQEYYKRKQTNIILMATVIPLVVATIAQILNMLAIPFPPLTIHTVALTIGLIGYALNRYSLVTDLSKPQIATAAARALMDSLFLVDLNDKISYANPVASQLTGYRFNQLLGKDIRTLFPVLPDRKGETTELFKKDQTSVPVSLSVLPVTGMQGSVYLARDLTSIRELNKSTQNIMTELGGRIEQEQKIKRPLLKMFKTLEIKRIERLWQELQNEPVEVQSVVRPYYELVKEFARISEEAESTGLALTDKVKELTELKSYSAEREKIYQGMLAELARLTT